MYVHVLQKKLQNKQIRVQVFEVCVYVPLLHQHGQ